MTDSIGRHGVLAGIDGSTLARAIPTRHAFPCRIRSARGALFAILLTMSPLPAETTTTAPAVGTAVSAVRAVSTVTAVSAVSAARRLIDVATPAQRAELLHPFTDAARSDWHYTPRRRDGLAWKVMPAPLREATTALLRSALVERASTRCAR